MDIEIRVPTRDDVDAIFDVRAQAFGVKEDDRERWTSLVDPSEMLTAFLGAKVVGSLRVLAMGQWFGGRPVPMGGIASVVVLPEHRGEGVAGRLLEAALGRMRERGLPVSTLHPATTRVYRAAGWEIAGDLASYRIPARSLERLPRGRSEDLRRLTVADWPAVRACYDEVAARHSGWVDRPDWLWDLFAKEDFVDQSFVYGVDGEDGLDGYLVFTQKANDRWGYTIAVEELTGARAVRGDHPVALPRRPRDAGRARRRAGRADRGAAPRPSRAGCRDRREQPVDAPHRRRARAIAARGYPPDVSAEVHLGLHDRLAPWNEGSWVLRVDRGRGELVAGGTGQVQLTINGFSALSTGWASTTALLAAGALHHATDADRRALDAIFAGPAPMMVDEF